MDGLRHGQSQWEWPLNLIELWVLLSMRVIGNQCTHVSYASRAVQLNVRLFH